MKKGFTSVAVGTVFLWVATLTAVSASTGPSPTVGEANPLAWLEEVPEYPVDAAITLAALSQADRNALADFKKNFPWEDAYAAFGCEVDQLVFDNDGGRSLQLDCTNATIDFEDSLLIPRTAIAASQGDADAITALTSGSVLTTRDSLSRSDISPMAASCAVKGSQNHCLVNDATLLEVGSSITRTTGVSTGTNRLGSLSVGTPCADGTLMGTGPQQTISTTSWSHVYRPTLQTGQYSSKWTMSAISSTRYCAVV